MSSSSEKCACKGGWEGRNYGVNWTENTLSHSTALQRLRMVGSSSGDTVQSSHKPREKQTKHEHRTRPPGEERPEPHPCLLAAWCRGFRGCSGGIWGAAPPWSRRWRPLHSAEMGQSCRRLCTARQPQLRGGAALLNRS